MLKCLLLITYLLRAAQRLKRQDKKGVGRDTDHFRPCYRKTDFFVCVFMKKGVCIVVLKEKQDSFPSSNII